DGRHHAWLEHSLAAVREMHGAFALDDVEGLVLVVAMHLVALARGGVVVDPGVEPLGVHDYRAALLSLCNLAGVEDLNGHVRPPGQLRNRGFAIVAAWAQRISATLGAVKDYLNKREEREGL